MKDKSFFFSLTSLVVLACSLRVR